MIGRKLVIEYIDYFSVDEMEPSDRELVAAAIDAQKGSYCPYSSTSERVLIRMIVLLSSILDSDILAMSVSLRPYTVRFSK